MQFRPEPQDGFEFEFDNLDSVEVIDAPDAPNAFDFTLPELKVGKPGSAERIQALSEHYAKHSPQIDYKGDDMGEGVSAFTISDDEIANNLAHAYTNMVKRDGSFSLKGQRKENKRNDRRTLE